MNSPLPFELPHRGSGTSGTRPAKLQLLSSGFSQHRGLSDMVNIFVGNLSPDTREQHLVELFKAHGTVESVTIVSDRDTGQSRGIAFVEMPHSAEALTAISALNGKLVNGRPLRVNEGRLKADEAPNQMSSRTRDHRRHRISPPEV